MFFYRNKGNFESHDRSKACSFIETKVTLKVMTGGKACSFILEDRECNPLFVTMDTGCKLNFKRDNIL